MCYNLKQRGGSMKTFFFDLDDTLIKLNWPIFEKAYYSGLGKAYSFLIPKEKVIAYIYQSYLYMIKVNDHRTNKDKFYDKMTELSGVQRDILINEEAKYYSGAYDKLQKITEPMVNMVRGVKVLQEKGYQMLIASQPIFPAMATEKRLAWLGFSPEDFLKVTSFETERSSKPWPEFYQSLLDEFGLDPLDCVMVGNDRKEDMVAVTLGMEGILITDELIDSDDSFICREMTSERFLTYVSEL